MENNREIMVSVFCTTYNHKKYISTCLDSLINQKTSFPYEIIVRDDASTDGTSDIVREYARHYPDKVVPFIQEENLFQQGLSNVSFEKMYQFSKGRYIALCEGDDFWTDENKLQKQVDFMEAHPDYSLCGHASYYASESGELMKDSFFRLGVSKDLSVEEVLSNWTMATSSLLYKKKCTPEIIPPFQGDCINGDIALMIYLALNGKVHYFDELMSAYRICSNGSVSQKAKKEMGYLIKQRTQYVAMLDRIDEYTKGRFSETIKRRKRITMFDLYLYLCDGKNLKKYKDVCKTVGYKVKIRYFLCVYFNPIYKRLFGR